jgi:hypothetical protein
MKTTKCGSVEFGMKSELEQTERHCDARGVLQTLHYIRNLIAQIIFGSHTFIQQ